MLVSDLTPAALAAIEQMQKVLGFTPSEVVRFMADMLTRVRPFGSMKRVQSEFDEWRRLDAKDPCAK